MSDRLSKVTRVVPLRDVTALVVLSALIDVWIASYGIPDSTLSDNGPQFASVLYQGVLQMLGVSTSHATPYHPQTNGQVERFNKTLVPQLRHYVREHVVTWARYVSLLVTAYNSLAHSSKGEALFSFVCPRKPSPVAIERLTQGTGDEAPPSTPRQACENFRKRLDEMNPLVQKSMDKTQARYKRHFDERVKSPREALRVGDWFFVKSHENQGGKLIFRTKGAYQVLKTDGRRLTIESTDGIRTINGNHATLAPEPRRMIRRGNAPLRHGVYLPSRLRVGRRWRLSSTRLSDRGMITTDALCSRSAGSGMDQRKTRGSMSRTFRLRRSASTANGIS